MIALHDPRIESAAIRLAFAMDAPSNLFPRLDQITDEHRRAWWRANSAGYRATYRYRASVAIEAFENAEVFDAAAE